MARRRQFGSIRQVQPSGRYQASYVGPDGRRRNAPTTFKRKADAARWLAAKEIDIARGRGSIMTRRESFGNYARGWLRDHQNMGPRYRETCLRNLRLHLAPLDEVQLGALSPYVVRTWYAEARRGTGGRTSIAQSYRFMRAVMNTAVREGIVAKNPCQVPGAGSDRAKERTVASVVEVVALVEAITPRYRAAVLLAAWCGLRRGEVLGLNREDIDLDAGTVTVRRNRVELLESARAFDGPPKTAAGSRVVNIPPHVLPVLAEHMETWAGARRVFVGQSGHPMRGDAVRQAFARARDRAGMDGFTFHDLRHTGQTLAAAAGATLKDLMKRLGHSSPAAATRYLHAVDGRDAEIASALSELAASGSAARLPRSITMRNNGA
jgi:integrase